MQITHKKCQNVVSVVVVILLLEWSSVVIKVVIMILGECITVPSSIVLTLAMIKYCHMVTHVFLILKEAPASAKLSCPCCMKTYPVCGLLTQLHLYVYWPLFFFSQPILRDAFEKNPSMSLDQARQVITRCLQVLFYRDARSLNKVCKPLLISIRHLDWPSGQWVDS